MLEETEGQLERNSSVSRVAEQLGWAIRQRNPSAVDPDSLRNASNNFLYVDPRTLPAAGPASMLTRGPHNFSRVFTGAFLVALGGMVRAQAATPRAEDILQASQDMGRLLVTALPPAAVQRTFFRSVAEQLLLADQALFAGKYADALTSAFVRRAILPMQSLAGPGRPTAMAATDASPSGTRKVTLAGSVLGLALPAITVEVPVDEAAPVLGIVEGAVSTAASDGLAFVQTLLHRGRILVGKKLAKVAAALGTLTGRRPTHVLVAEGEATELKRMIFDCGH